MDRPLWIFNGAPMASQCKFRRPCGPHPATGGLSASHLIPALAHDPAKSRLVVDENHFRCAARIVFECHSAAFRHKPLPFAVRAESVCKIRAAVVCVYDRHNTANKTRAAAVFAGFLRRIRWVKCLFFFSGYFILQHHLYFLCKICLECSVNRATDGSQFCENALCAHREHKASRLSEEIIAKDQTMSERICRA